MNRTQAIEAYEALVVSINGRRITREAAQARFAEIASCRTGSAFNKAAFRRLLDRELPVTPPAGTSGPR